MELDEIVRKDREFFDRAKKKYPVLENVIAGNKTLAQYVRDYHGQFTELVNTQQPNRLDYNYEYQHELYKQNVSEFERGFSDLVKLIAGEIERGLPNLSNPVTGYESEKEKARMRKIYKWTLKGGGTSVGVGMFGVLLSLLFFAPLCLPAFALVFSGLGASTLGGNKYMKSSKADPKEVLNRTNEYFSQMEKMAERADRRIRLAYRNNGE